jgi:hypothetical protein
MHAMMRYSKSDACNDQLQRHSSLPISKFRGTMNNYITHLNARKLTSLIVNNHVLSFFLFIYRKKKNNINTFQNKLLYDSKTTLRKKRKRQRKKSERI